MVTDHSDIYTRGRDWDCGVYAQPVAGFRPKEQLLTLDSLLRSNAHGVKGDLPERVREMLTPVQHITLRFHGIWKMLRARGAGW
jgi:hypothetical protein